MHRILGEFENSLYKVNNIQVDAYAFNNICHEQIPWATIY